MGFFFMPTLFEAQNGLENHQKLNVGVCGLSAARGEHELVAAMHSVGWCPVCGCFVGEGGGGLTVLTKERGERDAIGPPATTNNSGALHGGPDQAATLIESQQIPVRGGVDRDDGRRTA